jgi:exonuclease III
MRKKGMSPYVRDLIRDKDFDFLCFQETIIKDFPKSCLRQVDPDRSFLWDWVSSQGRSGGLLSGFKLDRFDVSLRHQGKFILQHCLWDKKLNLKWTVLNVYVPTQEENKDEFLVELATLCLKCKEPYIIGGDFNIIRFPSEKNKNFHPSRFSDSFNVVIHVNDLRELNILGGIFTWSNNQSSPTLERLDRILMNRDWELLFLNVCGYKEPRELSDHNPLIVSSCLRVVGNKREFRFELFWIKHPDFLKKVSEIWNAPTRDVNNIDTVLFKLKKVKKYLKGWGVQSFWI